METHVLATALKCTNAAGKALPRSDEGSLGAPVRSAALCLDTCMNPDAAGKARATSDVGPLGAPAMDDASGRALYVTVTLGLLDISLVDHKPEELLTASLAGLRLEFAAGIGPEGSFQRIRVSVQSVQIDDQMFASRWAAWAGRLHTVSHAFTWMLSQQAHCGLLSSVSAKITSQRLCCRLLLQAPITANAPLLD